MNLPPLIVLVHGIETADPADSIGRLGALFVGAGLAVAPLYQYGRQRVWDVRGSRDTVGYGLLSTLRVAAMGGRRQIIPVGHSRGCLAIHDAARLQYRDAQPAVFTRAVYLSPALDFDAEIPPLLDRVDVHFTRSDRAVWWARLLFCHPFGDMGRRGYRGDSAAVVNHNAPGHIAGHSGWWLPKGLAYVGDRLIPELCRSIGHRIPSMGFEPLT